MESKSINYRIKIFNKLIVELYTDIGDILQKDYKKIYKKITKYNEIQNFNSILEKNMHLLIDDKNPENLKQIFEQIKFLSKLNLNFETLQESNIKILYKYIKNLFYITIEDFEKAKEIKNILELDLDKTLKDLFSDNSEIKNMLEDFVKEIEPIVEQLDLRETIENLPNDVNISNLINNVLTQKNMDYSSLYKHLDNEKAKKMKELIEIIKDKFLTKIKDGKFNLNKLKDMIKH